MRTIEVYHLVGLDRWLVCQMYFINDKDFREMATRLTTAAPCTTVRRERHEACHIKVKYGNGFEMEYHTDGLPNKILNICTEYSIIYGHAKKLAERKGWLHAWLFSTPEWLHIATLKRMRKAKKLLKN